MVNTIYQILRTARPRQWLKNFSLFAAPFFAGRLFVGDVLINSFDAFLAFCAMSSGVYFLNDIIDAPKDRQHPVKKNRPIASGKLSPELAMIIAIVLIAGSVVFSLTYVGSFFTYALVGYVIIQLFYSLYFRNVIILDSMVVASGFVIRVFAGGLASSTSISSWLALTTIGVSLLLAFGKRRSEKTLLSHIPEKKDSGTRATLRHYPDTLLDAMITMSATYTMVSYSIFTFEASPKISVNVLATILPSILKSPKWMMLTIPMVLYGIARYLYVIYERQEGESPERVLLSDRPLLFTVTLWASAVFLITYILGALIIF